MESTKLAIYTAIGLFIGAIGAGLLGVLFFFTRPHTFDDDDSFVNVDFATDQAPTWWG